MKGEAEGIGAVGFGRGMESGSAVWYMGNLFGILADSGETGGRFALIETLSRKGTEPPRHTHRNEDEAWYVLEGEVSFYIGDETRRATPGSFGFETEVIRMLILLAPGGPEEHFRDRRFSEPAQALTLPPPPEGPPDVAALVADMERYGVEVVGPPGPPVQG